MKALSVLLVTCFLSTAHASWTSTKCSNSDGTVFWTQGDDENEINLKYANFIEGTLTLNIDQVNIQMSESITIDNKQHKECSYASTKHVFAGTVEVTAHNKNPDVLRSLFPENKIDTEVICTTFTHNTLPCED